MKLQHQLFLSHLAVTLISLGLLLPFLLFAYAWFSQSRFAASWVVDEATNIANTLEVYLKDTHQDLTTPVAQSFLFQSMVPEFISSDMVFAASPIPSDEQLYNQVLTVVAPDKLSENVDLANLPQPDLSNDVIEVGGLASNVDIVGTTISDASSFVMYEPIVQSNLFVLDADGNTLTSSVKADALFTKDQLDFLKTKPSLKKLGGNFFAQSPVFDDAGSVLAWIILMYPVDSVRFVFKDLGRNLTSFAVGLSFMAIVISALASVMLARRYGRRISTLQEASSAISQGNFGVDIPVSGNDELTKLAYSFRHMVSKVNEQLSELKALAQFNQDLMSEKEALARAEERHHLARELHDAVKQQIFALHLSMGGLLARRELREGKSHAELEDLSNLSHKILLEMDYIIRELRPDNLEGMGIVNALDTYIQEFEQRTGFIMSFQAEPICELSLKQEQCLFRVTQEALSNANKHAEARQVNVSLKMQSHEIALSIKDDGKGFDLSDQKKRTMGLHNMRERVAAEKGRLIIETAPNQGCQVRVYLNCLKQGDE